MALFHVNPATGDAGKCSASKGRCPFGGEKDHFTSPEAARAAYENSQSSFLRASLPAISEELPAWVGKLPPSLEKRIMKEWMNFQEDEDTDSERLVTPEEHLDPPVYAVRARSSYFVKVSELEDPGYDGNSEYLVALHSRQGGGNRECYCEGRTHEPGCTAKNNEELESHPQYAFYEDDEWDRTYTTHYFDPGITQATVDLVEVHQRKLADNLRKRAIKSLIQSGSMPPWGVLAQDKRAPAILHEEYATAKRNLATAEKNWQELSKENALVQKAVKGLSEGKQLPDDELKEIGLLVRDNIWDKGERFAKAYSSHIRARAERQRVESMVAQAEALAPGELKDYLLGDRGKGSYTVNEMRGRRKVPVTKEYSKGTLLGEELKSVKRGETNSEIDLKPYREKLKMKQKELKDAADKLTNAQKTFDRTRAKAWKTGWPAGAGDIPEIPEEF